ncbi:MAG: hypothetical protein PUD83_06055 [Bacteroidales bacterium]|nr:hypothetical protein [Bacteroidales bacterium]
MQLTDHFHLSEFVRSETATRLGIDNSINDPEIIANIKNLCEHVLEPLRAFAAPSSSTLAIAAHGSMRLWVAAGGRST